MNRPAIFHSRRVKRARRFAIAAVSFVLAMCALPVFAQNTPVSPFSDYYTPVGGVGEQQTQIVFYRPQGQTSHAAHVYIDSELEAALLPGGYTVFCVSPGSHSLESYVDDAPQYTGKNNPEVAAEFKGGRTYFVRVSDDVAAHTPVVQKRADAEAELSGLRRQTHIINRASAARSCSNVQQTTFTKRADVLFGFARGGYADITSEGRTELRALAEAIKAMGSAVRNVDVNGFADPIGAPDFNLRLSQQRAQTVRNALLSMGVNGVQVNAAGYGSTDPVVVCPANRPLQERIACNAPNRRVDISVSATATGE